MAFLTQPPGGGNSAAAVSPHGQPSIQPPDPSYHVFSVKNSKKYPFGA
jgi:hypothetical protein